MTAKYFKTAQISLRAQTNGGIWYLLPKILIRLVYLLPLMLVWRVLLESGAQADMSLTQMLSYTYLNALLTDLLVVRTQFSGWTYEGELVSLFNRPMPLFGQIIAQTVGEWIPMLLAFSLPMALFSPLFGVSLRPATPWFFISLLLCVSLGFAIDFVFACFTIRLKGMAWLVYMVRMSIIALFSGAVIPFQIMPFGLGRIFALQPFGSLGGASLSLFVGLAEPVPILLPQLVWNIVLWPTAYFFFQKTQEKMVSYGG